MKQRKMSLEKVVLNCEKEYSRWGKIHSSGCRDPSRHDGCNLNLVPNHIISYKKQIESYCAERSVERPPFLLRECLRAIKNNQLVTMRQMMRQADEILACILDVLAKANTLSQETCRLTSFDTA